MSNYILISMAKTKDKSINCAYEIIKQMQKLTMSHN